MVKRCLIIAVVYVISFLGFNDNLLFARNRIVLSSSKPIASQILPSDKSPIYIIEDNLDLKKSTVKLPQDAILQFEGGCLSNGKLIGNYTTIVAGKYRIFDEILISGTWTLDGIPVEWFGAVPNNFNYDCAKAINKAISTGVSVNAPALLGSGTYYTNVTVNIPENGALIGSSPSSTTIRFHSDVGVFMSGRNTTLKNVCVREHKAERIGTCIKVGDAKDKVSCTRGYIEDIKAIGGNYGLALEYQWCNKISGVCCNFNEIGIYANATTPYIENAVIEGNYTCGVFSEISGIKLYNAIIEGNKIGCILNGRENLLNNCYFEGNTASERDSNAVKDIYGSDVEGGHIYAGDSCTITNLIMTGCHVVNKYKNNNTIRVNRCMNFTAIGCNSLSYLDLTDNCNVKYIDQTYESEADYGEYSLASRTPHGYSKEIPSVYQCFDFSNAVISDSDSMVSLDEKGYYQIWGNKSRIEHYKGTSLLCLRNKNEKYRGFHFRVYNPSVLEKDSDIVLSTSVRHPTDMVGITANQNVLLTGLTEQGKEITVRIGKTYTSTNRKVRAGKTTSYDVRIKRSYINELIAEKKIIKVKYITMNNSLFYDTTDVVTDRKEENEYVITGLSVGLAKSR